ncbi:MAG TPA: CBS domain-containing protein [Myxococcaceae bacterium]|nr:CBS domain-containing protein [Myxococcaceae bacterium]
MYTVADLMTRDVLTLRPEDDLSLAETILALGGIRHLPVVDEDLKLVGLVTQRDVLRSCSNISPLAKRALLAREVMTQHLHTVQSITPLRHALQVIVENKVGCLPVVEKDGRLIGILTETDVVRFAFDQVAAEEARSGRAEARPA